MKTILTKCIASALLIAAVAAPTVAATKNPPHNINRRLARQQHRINQGIRSGELTKGETARLERRDRSIMRADMRDRRNHGGHLTVAERRHIEGRLNRTSGAIHRMKHNRRTM